MKNIKAPKLVTIGVLTLITIVFWVGFEVFRTFTKKPDTPVPQAILNPINPTLDQAALSTVQGRVYLQEGQIGQTVVQSPTPEPTVAATETPLASPSASPSTTPEATASATPQVSATPEATP